jgi:catechol 2,3-dioxygenase-like lactoylglutathione lyase family enzyme
MTEHSQASVLHPAELVGFLATADSVRCREFYTGKLGFRVESEDSMALVLNADGRMIRIQKAREHTPRPYTVLGWNVADIEAAVARLAAAGVSCERFGFPGQDERGIMTFSDGTRVAWFKDPDANILSVAQMPR